MGVFWGCEGDGCFVLGGVVEEVEGLDGKFAGHVAVLVSGDLAHSSILEVYVHRGDIYLSGIREFLEVDGLVGEGVNGEGAGVYGEGGGLGEVLGGIYVDVGVIY